MARGIIRQWRGHHGFIEPTSGSEPSVFVHVEDLPASLRIGNVRRTGLEVEYECIDTAQGPRASSVRVIR